MAKAFHLRDQDRGNMVGPNFKYINLQVNSIALLLYVVPRAFSSCPANPRQQARCARLRRLAPRLQLSSSRQRPPYRRAFRRLWRSALVGGLVLGICTCLLTIEFTKAHKLLAGGRPQLASTTYGRLRPQFAELGQNSEFGLKFGLNWPSMYRGCGIQRARHFEIAHDPVSRLLRRVARVERAPNNGLIAVPHKERGRSG